MNILIGFLFINISMALALPSDWKLVSNEDEVKVWQLNSDKLITASQQSRNLQTPIGSNQQKEYFKKFENKKKAALSFVGITDWKAKNYSWKNQSLSIEGSYKDTQGRDIEFREIHIFKPLKCVQFLFTHPIGTKSAVKKQIDEFQKTITAESFNQ